MYEQIQKVFNILISNGYQCYIAGGAVRDIVRGIPPHNYDFTTDATPDIIIRIFESTGYKAIPTGIEHGTITVIVDEMSFQITTYRVDTECDGRHCKVKFTPSLEEYIKRRDLTVNALVMDINNKIIDLVNGIDDIKNKIIRSVGDPEQRFIEDYLRILRAIRFYTTLDFEIEPNTYNAIKKLYPNLIKISRERIRDEFNKILQSSNRLKGLLMLYDLNIIDMIIPNFSLLANVQQPLQFHPEGDVLSHTFLVMEQIEEGDSLDLIISVLLHDKGKLDTYAYDLEKERITFNGHDIVGANLSIEILSNLKYDNDTIDRVYYIISNHMKFHQKMSKSTIKRLMIKKTDKGFAYNPTFDDLFKLYKYEINASLKEKVKDIENYEETFRIIDEIKEELKEELKRQSLQRLITGYDIMALGIPPGPIISEIMDEIEDLQLEGTITTCEGVRAQRSALAESEATASPSLGRGQLQNSLTKCN